ncbi:MFS transporter [Sulfolobus acidocaldarius SUSAZ]|nr:MFS transporter [Sulfolobus acidocaldarius SUSAZ]
MEKIVKSVDASKWTTVHTLMFASVAVGYFMWGVISSIAPLLYPNINSVLFLLTPTLAALAGNLILSFFSDRKLGRKVTFFITMTLYSVGTILIILASVLSGFNTTSLAQFPYILLIVIGIILGEFGVEGEVPVMLSYSAEMMPINYRDSILILGPNFDNIGATVAALIGYLTFSLSNSFMIELLAVSLVAVLGIVFAIVIRFLLPESVRWLVTKGDLGKAEKEASKVAKETRELDIQVQVKDNTNLTFRYIILVVLGVAQYLTYGLMAFTVADYYFSSSQTPFIIFIANLGASVSGFLATLVVRRINTRMFSMISYLGGTLSMIPIVLLTMNFNIQIFFVLLFVNMLFSEFSWAVRTVYEPVLMPSNVRAFMIGLIRIFPITAYGISLVVTSSFSLVDYLILNFALWLMGGIVSVIWYIKGVDTYRVPLEKLEKK